MDPLILGAAALALLALGKRTPASRTGGAVSGGSGDPEAEILFPPITAPAKPPKEYWCSLGSTYGGKSDESKVILASELYVSRWGFDPPDAFRAYIAALDPCEPRHVPNDLIDQFPPFPGQRIKARDLARIAKEQAQRRAIVKKQQFDAIESCKQTAALVGTIAGVGAAAGLTAAGVPPNLAGSAVPGGKAVGSLIGGFC